MLTVMGIIGAKCLNYCSELFTKLFVLEVSCSHIVIIYFQVCHHPAYITSINAEHYVLIQIIWNNKCLVCMY